MWNSGQTAILIPHSTFQTDVIYVRNPPNHHRSHPRHGVCDRRSAWHLAHDWTEARGDRKLLQQGVRAEAGGFASLGPADGCVRAEGKFEDHAQSHLTPETETLYSLPRFGR